MALADKGRTEATAAGVTMAEAGLRFDTSLPSLQTRAVVTRDLALGAMDQAWLPVELDSPGHPANDPYSHLPPHVLPASERLKDVVDRVLPYWYDRAAPRLLNGRNVLVTAHGNSLQALLEHLRRVSDAKIAEVNIPTGAPRRDITFDDRLRVATADYPGDAEDVTAAAAIGPAQAGTAH